jgi:hypothetical protein
MRQRQRRELFSTYLLGGEQPGGRGRKPAAYSHRRSRLMLQAGAALANMIVQRFF